MAAQGEVVIRVSTGRYGDERQSAMADAELVEAVLGEIAALLGLREAPLDAHVQRWPRAFPQYLPGHLGKIERAQAALSKLPVSRWPARRSEALGSRHVSQVASGPWRRFSIA